MCSTFVLVKSFRKSQPTILKSLIWGWNFPDCAKTRQLMISLRRYFRKASISPPQNNSLQRRQAFLERLQTVLRDFLSLEAEQSNNKKEKSQQGCWKAKQRTTTNLFIWNLKDYQKGVGGDTENNHSSWGLGAPVSQWQSQDCDLVFKWLCQAEVLSVCLFVCLFT